jgi:monofunctional biosynthetic peptidoglycan transglycosylase
LLHVWLRRLAFVALISSGSLLFLIVVFRFVNPPLTTVMVAERLRGHPIQHRWVSLDEISPELPIAVTASEDGRFCFHWGVDWAAMRQAIREVRRFGGEMRGASTIPMQTAKNLFLWKGRSYVRKALEMPIAYVLSLLWPKRRIMEVYLNIAQWGPGVFGAEAASEYHFHKHAAELTREEAALLAATLPNPKVRKPGKPGPLLGRLANVVEKRMVIMAPRSACVAGN